jgi:hypothetical protein
MLKQRNQFAITYREIDLSSLHMNAIVASMSVPMWQSTQLLIG